MTDTVVPADASRLGEAAVVYARAFHTDPVFSRLCRNPVRRPATLRHVFTAEARDAHRWGTLSIAVEDGSVVGAACWFDNHSYPPRGRRAAALALRTTPALIGFGAMVRPGLAALAAMERNHPRREEFRYLSALAVDPTRQGRGVGRRLMERQLEACDEEGIGCYLETATAENVSWYGRVGFEPRSSEPAWRGGPTMWFLWRDPR